MESKLLKSIRTYAGNRSSFIPTAMFFSVVSSVCSMLPYLYIYYIMDEVIRHVDDGAYSTVINNYAWMALLFAVGGIILYFVSLSFSHLAAFRVERMMRYKAMEKILSFPLAFFDRNTTGKIRKIIDDNAAITHVFIAHQLPDLCGALTMTVLFILAILLFDWRFGIIILCAIILSIIFIKQMMGGAQRESMKQYLNALEDMNSEAVEYVRGIPVVKTFQQSVYTFKGFHRTIVKYKDWANRFTLSCKKPLIRFTLSIQGLSIIFVFMVILLIRLGNPIPFIINPFVFYVIFAPLCAVMMNKIMHLGDALGHAQEAINRIDGLFDQPILPENTSDVAQLQDFSVSFENVSFSYNDSQQDDETNLAIRNVSFTIDEGKSIALVGPSGGGKSTIAKLIPRFADVNSGCIKIGGVDIRKIPHEKLMSYVTFVFQNSQLFKMTLLDNVKYAKPNATLKEVQDALSIAQCDDIVEKLPQGLNTLIGTKGIYLSGGEQQRIFLARAILKDAPIIILDEATAYADPENESRFQQAFAQMSKNKTVIIIAHRLSSIKNADNIIVINKSEIAESGTHSDLIQKEGLYASMWDEYQQSIQWKI